MWCFAHSAADLVTQKLGRRVSAFDLAAKYLLGDEERLLQNPAPDVQRALQEDPRFLPRLYQWRLEDRGAYEPARILGERGLYFLGGMDQDAILLSFESGFCADSRLPGSAEAFPRYLKEINTFARKHCGREGIENCSYPDPGRIGSVPEAKSRPLAALFRRWTDQMCGQRIHPEIPVTARSVDVAGDLKEDLLRLQKGEITRQETQQKLFAEIDLRLDQSTAVSIGYDFSDIAEPEDPKDPLADHSSVIAARRKFGSECRYFLRTHSGAECGYRGGVEKFCEKKAGGVWVSRADLPSIYAVVSIRQ